MSLKDRIIEIEAWINEKGNVLWDARQFELGRVEGLRDAEIKKQIKSGDIVVPGKVWSLIVKIVGFVGTALAIIVWLINA